MPIARLSEFEEVGDAEKRRDFLLWVRKTLGHLVEEADREYWRVFVPDLIGPMEDAWGEVEPQFEVLADSAADLAPGQVVRHGLGGAQLDFKLATVRYWAQRFIDQQSIALNRAAKGILRWLLNAINTLLTSLASAVGAGTALQEMKDAIRDAIAADDDGE